MTPARYLTFRTAVAAARYAPAALRARRSRDTGNRIATADLVIWSAGNLDILNCRPIPAEIPHPSAQDVPFALSQR